MGVQCIQPRRGRSHLDLRRIDRNPPPRARARRKPGDELRFSIRVAYLAIQLKDPFDLSNPDRHRPFQRVVPQGLREVRCIYLAQGWITAARELGNRGWLWVPYVSDSLRFTDMHVSLCQEKEAAKRINRLSNAHVMPLCFDFCVRRSVHPFAVSSPKAQEHARLSFHPVLTLGDYSGEAVQFGVTARFQPEKC